MLRSVLVTRKSLIARGLASRGKSQLFPSLQLVFQTDQEEDRRSFATKTGGGDRKPGRKPRKDNFDQDVLQPAQRGELVGKKHGSGISKLAARKRKVHLTPVGPRGTRPDVLVEEGGGDEEEEIYKESARAGEPGRKSLYEALSQGRMADRSEGQGDEDAFGYSDDYYAASLIDDDKYFWREEEYDVMDSVIDELLLEEGLDGEDEEAMFEIPFTKEDSQAQPDTFLATVDNDDIDPIMRMDTREDGAEVRSRRKEEWERMDPEEHFFFGQHDIFSIAEEDESTFEKDEDGLNHIVMPLQDHGSELDDFEASMIEHPTMFANITYNNLHPHSLREPKPDFPRNRINPPLDFVEAYARFLYVDNLPRLEVNGEVGDLENPVHRSFLQKSIARLVGVDSSRVFPASTTSGFVGFDSPKDLADAIARGPSEKYVSNPPDILLPMEEDANHDFIKNAPEDTVVLLTNLPPDLTPTSLAEELFPIGTEVGTVYGQDLTSDSFFVLSPNKVLLRFSSQEQAESSLDSNLIQERFEELGRYPVSYFRARRELVHAGFAKPTRKKEIRKPGPRLVVDGDMPSKDFFMSHARLLHLRGLPPTITKQEISDLFQPNCTQRRDEEGSIEFVTCEGGHFTGKAYVGFDLPGEAEASMVSGGRLVIGDRTVVMRLVKDRSVPNRPPAIIEKRPERPAEELLQDLNNWEQFVDPADIEELEKAGISKVVLDEALRNFRFHNTTFGALDSSLRSEALKPETERGGMYKELVQLYVKTLKGCLPTKDNVGDLYQALHFPDEAIDLSVFDREEERQKMLHDKRANPQQ